MKLFILHLTSYLTCLSFNPVTTYKIQPFFAKISQKQPKAMSKFIPPGQFSEVLLHIYLPCEFHSIRKKCRWNPTSSPTKYDVMMSRPIHLLFYLEKKVLELVQTVQKIKPCWSLLQVLRHGSNGGAKRSNCSNGDNH